MSALPHLNAPETLDQQGFAVIRGLLDRVTLQRVRYGFDTLLSIARRLDGTTTVSNTRFVVTPEPFRLHRAVWCSGAAPGLQLGNHPPTLAIAMDALGTDTPVQLIQQAHYKLPGDGVCFKWHQDASNRRYPSDLWTDINGRGSFIQIAVAVDPMGPENGGLQFIPGSHRAGFLADPLTGDLPDGTFDVDRAVCPELDAGDAVIFGPFVIHGSSPNVSDTPRRTFLQGFASPGANRRSYPGCGTGVVRTLR